MGGTITEENVIKQSCDDEPLVITVLIRPV